MSTDEERSFFATAARGTEGALRDELRELRLPKVRADRGGVHFGGGFAHAMRACLRSRIGLRILWRQAEFQARDPEALYEGTRGIDWSRWLDQDRTLAVYATVKNSTLTHTGFVAQKIKDAVVDQLRERDGERPDVAPGDPDVRIVAHVERNRAQIFVDLAGTPLSKRGYRTQSGEAPLREHLAAAMLRLGGFRPGTPLFDPMCGSGTLPIEAAVWAEGRPAGGLRPFGFERWRCFDDAAQSDWALERQRAVDFAEPIETEIRGSDRDPRALKSARGNAKRAGVDVRFDREDLAGMTVPPKGTLVLTNPPYGVRLERDQEWLDDFRDALARLQGSTVVAITPDRSLPEHVGAKATREHTLYNGDLECRLFTWET
ncbi:MAG: THUMP domain-containing protein [Candidatus Binatia bacterium]|nr:THUMP domain-containing protein [Candidatus Binatia bacterium]